MSGTEVLPEIAPPALDRDDEITHLVCCTDASGSLAFCGKDVTGEPWFGPDEGQDCVVCVDLYRVALCPLGRQCERSGAGS